MGRMEQSDDAGIRSVAGRAAALEAHGASGEAVALWSRLVDRAPASIDARLGLALSHIRASRPRDALPHLDIALAAPDPPPAAWLAMGVARALLGDYPQARRACERAVALAPGVPAAHLGLGDVLYRTGDYAGAGQAYERALSLDPDDADALNKLATIARTERRHDDAEALLVRALACDPDHPYARINLGTLALRRHRLDDARRWFEGALAIPRLPDDARAVARDALAMMDERDAMAEPVADALATDDPAAIERTLRSRGTPGGADARAVDEFAALVERARRAPPIDDRFASGRPASAAWPAIEAHCCYRYDRDADGFARSVRIVAGNEPPASLQEADLLRYARVVASRDRDLGEFGDAIAYDAWLRWTHARLVGHRSDFWPGMVKPTGNVPGGAMSYARTPPGMTAATLRAMLACLADGLSPGAWRATLVCFAILAVHPCYNANKRLARCAMNRELAAAGLMPVLNVPGSDRELLRHTAAARKTGDLQPIAEMFASASREARALDAAWARPGAR